MSLLVGVPAAVAPARVRSAGVDRVRGLAIACMVVDHLCLIFGGPDVLRGTVGRLAVPLFFVVSGYLVTRLTDRHLWVLAAGCLLPLGVVWVDSPNVLVWYVVGAAVLVASRRLRIPPAVWVVLGLTFGANHYALRPGTSYDPVMLVGLMAVGQLLKKHAQDPARVFSWGERLPALLGVVGRRPLTWYLGHVLVLNVAWVLGYWRV